MNRQRNTERLPMYCLIWITYGADGKQQLGYRHKHAISDTYDEQLCCGRKPGNRDALNPTLIHPLHILEDVHVIVGCWECDWCRLFLWRWLAWEGEALVVTQARGR